MICPKCKSNKVEQETAYGWRMWCLDCEYSTNEYKMGPANAPFKVDEDRPQFVEP